MINTMISSWTWWFGRWPKVQQQNVGKLLVMLNISCCDTEPLDADALSHSVMSPMLLILFMILTWVTLQTREWNSSMPKSLWTEQLLYSWDPIPVVCLNLTAVKLCWFCEPVKVDLSSDVSDAEKKELDADWWGHLGGDTASWQMLVVFLRWCLVSRI